MADPVHAAVKEIDRNRWTYALAAVAAALPFLLVSCGLLEARVASPTTGQALTADELEVEGSMTIAELDSTYEEAQAAANSILARRNTLALIYNEAVRKADEASDERVALIRGTAEALLNNPFVLATGMGGVAASLLGNVGQFMDRRRKDRLILEARAKA